MRSIGRQGETSRNSDAAPDVQTRARSRYIADDAGEGVAAEPDRGGGSDSVPCNDPPLEHRGTCGGACFDHMQCAAATEATVQRHIVAFGAAGYAVEHHTGFAFLTGGFRMGDRLHIG